VEHKYAGFIMAPADDSGQSLIDASLKGKSPGLHISKPGHLFIQQGNHPFLIVHELAVFNNLLGLLLQVIVGKGREHHPGREGGATASGHHRLIHQDHSAGLLLGRQRGPTTGQPTAYYHHIGLNLLETG
jgi:hypothetical protein